MKTLEQIIRPRFQFDRLDEAMGSYPEFEALAKEIWNSAMDRAAEQACTNCHCVEGYCNGIDKQSITDLKFKTDEK